MINIFNSKYSEHSTVLKGRGGIPPSQEDEEEVDGAKMIMDLIKSTFFNPKLFGLFQNFNQGSFWLC